MLLQYFLPLKFFLDSFMTLMILASDKLIEDISKGSLVLDNHV